MPKILGTLADVSTEYVLIEPDDYQMKITKIDVEEKSSSETNSPADYPNGQYTYIVESRVDDPDSEHNNKPVRDYINWYKKGPEGAVNEYSKMQLKRYFEAVLGEEEANRDDLDTDELIGGTYNGTVYIDSYKDRNGNDRQTNRIKNIVRLD